MAFRERRGTRASPAGWAQAHTADVPAGTDRAHWGPQRRAGHRQMWRRERANSDDGISWPTEHHP